MNVRQWGSSLVLVWLLIQTTAFAAEVPVESPNGYVVALMPKPPRSSTTSKSTAVGRVDTEVWASSGPDGFYSVSTSRLPRFATALASDAMILNRTRKQLLQEIQAREIAFRKIPHRDLLLMELSYTVDETGRRGRAQMAMVNKTLMVVTGEVTSTDQARLDQYFDSVVFQAQVSG